MNNDKVMLIIPTQSARYHTEHRTHIVLPLKNADRNNVVTQLYITFPLTLAYLISTYILI
jgi:hypothetical protein